MAILSRSAFGGFSGKLGNVVGYCRRGTWCVRVRPVSIKNPRTEAQQHHRTMFAEEVRLAGRMGWGIGVGLKAVAEEGHMTVHNAFVSLNQQAFSLVEGAFEVDWSQINVSAGPVAPVSLTSAEVDEENVLKVRFEPNPLEVKADRFDSVYVWVFCPEMEDGFLAAPVYRMDKRVRLMLPNWMRGREIHIYAFAIDKEGNASMSSYQQPHPPAPYEEPHPPAPSPHGEGEVDGMTGMTSDTSSTSSTSATSHTSHTSSTSREDCGAPPGDWR